MAAKLVQLSSDNVTYYTLPGAMGTLDVEAAQEDDTVFGQSFKSIQGGSVKWTGTADAKYKGFAGYKLTLKGSGGSTVMTAEACAVIASAAGCPYGVTYTANKCYQITNAAHQVINRQVAIVVKDNGVNQNANVLYVDYLFGIIVFKTAYTVTGPVTIDGAWLAMAAVGKIQTITLGLTAEVIQSSDFATLQGNGGYEVYIPGLRTVHIDLSDFYDLTHGFRASVLASTEIVLEVCADGNNQSRGRGYFKLTKQGVSGNVGALEEEKITANLSVPSDPILSPLLLQPWTWFDASTSTLSTAIQKAMAHYILQSTLYVKYLPDGGTTANAGGFGTCVLTDVSLSSALNAMNIFSVKWQGSGTLTAV